MTVTVLVKWCYVVVWSIIEVEWWEQGGQWAGLVTLLQSKYVQCYVLLCHCLRPGEHTWCTVTTRTGGIISDDGLLSHTLSFFSPPLSPVSLSYFLPSSPPPGQSPDQNLQPRHTFCLSFKFTESWEAKCVCWPCILPVKAPDVTRCSGSLRGSPNMVKSESLVILQQSTTITTVIQATLHNNTVRVNQASSS